MSGAPMDHARIEEIVAAYALGSLERGDEAERELLEHIPGCESCGALFRDLREVSSDLALAAPARAVPSDLEARILRRIRGEVQPAVVRASRPRPRWVPVVAAAVSVVLVATAGLGLSASLSRRIDRAEARAALAAEALALMAQPEAVRIPLSGDGTGTLSVTYTPDGRGYLVGTGIAHPGAGRILELWVIGGGTPKPAGAFVPDDGLVYLPVRVASGETRFAVTIERRLESVPTSEPLYAS